MICRNAYIVVHEGSSETKYLNYLMQFINNNLLGVDDYVPRFNLIPRITNNGCGTGMFVEVRKTCEKCRRENPKTKIMVWVDADIYLRCDTITDKKNSKAYSEKKSLPDFHFSVMNFEDFLALHFPDDVFEEWYEVMQSSGHFIRPLHSDEYLAKFNPIWTKLSGSNPALNLKSYKKGTLSVDFISKVSLANMIRHLKDNRIQRIYRSRDMTALTFPEFLSSILLNEYPEVFSGVST